LRPIYLVLLSALILGLSWAILHVFRTFFSSLEPKQKPAVFAWSLFVLIFALLATFRTPYHASNLEIVPDSVEYAIGARNLASSGNYEIEINHTAYPSRYAPWFSALLLAPAYIIFGTGEIGNAVYALLLLASVALLSVFYLGYYNSKASGGVWAIILLYSIPSYFFYSRQIMSDVPALSLMLAALLFYCIISQGNFKFRKRDFLAAGLLCAFAALLRPGYFALLVPFVLLLWRAADLKAKLGCLILLTLPSVLGFSATLIYNFAAFGSFFRSGYNFWVGWPYDFINRTFSIEYFWSNFRFLIERSWFGFYLVLLVLVYFMDRGTSRCFAKRKTVLNFAWPLSLAIIVIYLPYFYREPRFYLPLLAPLALSIGLTISEITNKLLSVPVLPKVLGAFLLCGAAAYQSFSTCSDTRRHTADLIEKYTPSNAMVISGLDPVFLSGTAGENSARVFIPISRRVEYASKLISFSTLSFGAVLPANVFEHRSNLVKRAGGQDAVQATATEMLEDLAAFAEKGQALYLDGSELTQDEMSTILKHFRLEKLDGKLFRLSKL